MPVLAAYEVLKPFAGRPHKRLMALSIEAPFLDYVFQLAEFDYNVVKRLSRCFRKLVPRLGYTATPSIQFIVSEPRRVNRVDLAMHGFVGCAQVLRWITP